MIKETQTRFEVGKVYRIDRNNFARILSRDNDEARVELIQRMISGRFYTDEGCSNFRIDNGYTETSDDELDWEESIELNRKNKLRLWSSKCFDEDQVLIANADLISNHYLMATELEQTKTNLEMFIGHIEELYKEFAATNFSYVDGWPELDIIRDGLNKAKFTAHKLLRDIEEDESNDR